MHPKVQLRHGLSRPSDPGPGQAVERRPHLGRGGTGRRFARQRRREHHRRKNHRRKNHRRKNHRRKNHRQEPRREGLVVSSPAVDRQARTATAHEAADSGGRAARYTAEQRAAIETRGTSIAISAGAGCGKTFVLTERYLAALSIGDVEALDAHPLMRLVAITFTERAAREMRDRIRAKLYERRRDAATNEERDAWQRLLRELDAARISTIHAFCARLLRAHAVEAELDPQFAVLDQSESETLLAETIDDGLRELLTAHDENVLDLIYNFGIRGLRDHVRRLNASTTRDELVAWQPRSIDDILAAWDTYHSERVVPQLIASLLESPDLRRARELLFERTIPSPQVLETRGQLESLLARLAEADATPELLAELRECLKVANVGQKKGFANTDEYDDFRDTCERLRKTLGSLTPLARFDIEAARPAAELGQRLLQVTLALRDRYEHRKRDAAQLDFNDLLSQTHRLLRGPRGEAICRRWTDQVDLLLVDEFQDTDPLQEQLVRRLCGAALASGKLFFVGDFKQSIYRFRGARPEVFRQLQGDIPESGRLPLSRNFRSQPAILDFVNALFHDAFGDDYLPLVAHRAQVAEQPAIEFLWSPAEAGRAAGSARLARQREAEWIARRLRNLIEEAAPLVYVADDQPPRAVQLGDIALLFRSLSDIDIYEEALRRYQLDYYLVGGHAFYAQQEIFDLVNLLRSLVSNCDAVSLAGVLRSPFFALTDETLFWLAQHPDGLGAGLFAATLPKEIDAAQRRQVEFAAATLGELKAAKNRLPVADLLNLAIARTGYDAVLLTEFMGERKLANLQKLIQLARNFDRARSFGLSEFITQLTDFVARTPREAPAATLAEDNNVIRLMTIHQAKGLEFPVVVVPDMNRGSHGHDPGVGFADELGVVVQFPQERRPNDGVTGLEMYRAREASADEEERDRLLYVATTRAADYLILSSSLADPDKPSSTWLKRLAGRFDLATGELRDELPEEYPEPPIRVTLDEPPEPHSGKAARHHGQLKRLLEKTKAEAAAHVTEVPRGALPWTPRASDRREFSFSGLSGEFGSAVETDAAAARGEEPVVPAAEATSHAFHERAAREATQLGTLVHEILAEPPWPSEDQLVAVVDRAAATLAIPPGVVREEALALVSGFLLSEPAAAIAAAAEVHQELEFLLDWPAEARAGERSRLRGFIDCLYRDADGDWHIVDYKTNRTTAESVDQVAASYRPQMLLYGLAAERALGVAPASLTLWFLRPGVGHDVPYNEETRRELEAFLERSMTPTA
ncbi:MAG: hypothetical protein DWQ31_12695 [Planctomycetota bacterium]|nr:MAG: hypothetical protein DWQ31_12695 [Planctomycetota bacterium]